MSLNIKNEETCRLAAELAELTGETKTGAITLALRERLAREKRGARQGGAPSRYPRNRRGLRQSHGAGSVGRRDR